ncbi:MAG: PA2169 family four-helix-bundle protein [Ilumatobacteraceae bacterium]
MSTDEKTTSDLIETLKNGEEGFKKSAEKLAGDSRGDLSTEFMTFSQQRARFAAELSAMAQAYGDDISQRSTVPGAVHRGWIAVKDALTGSSPDAVLKAALTGEDHAVEEYEDALKEDISVNLRAILARQLVEVRAARDRVKALVAKG